MPFCLAQRTLVADDLVFEFEALFHGDAVYDPGLPVLSIALGEAFLALATELALVRLTGV